MRIGGACAIYHASKDLELVRRYGRWATSVFHVYLWETGEDAKGLAEKMAVPRGVLLASRGLGVTARGGVGADSAPLEQEPPTAVHAPAAATG